MSNFYPLGPVAVEKIWGGKLLSKLRNLQMDDVLVGETWEVSTHPDGNCRSDGTDLIKVLNDQELSYLIKFINTESVLSVQVHPEDEYSLANEGQLGKTECWMILDAKPGAGIYLGFKNDVDPSEFHDRVSKGEDISELLNFIPVNRGDFFYVPAGTIHAIGAGLLLAEIQQSSGVTYRVWDWNRVGLDGNPRELHIDKACDVLNFKKSDVSDYRLASNTLAADSSCLLVEHKDFKVELLSFKSNGHLKLEQLSKHSALTVLSGSFQLTSSGESFDLAQMNSVLLGETDELNINGEGYLLLTRS
jgi:mannose-6-phosphate isomerase